MSNSKDYYQILGISKSAGDADIKAAYRKLAREYHPDVAKGDKATAEKKFKEVNEAYQVLGDSQKKKMYDTYGSAGPGFGGGQGPFRNAGGANSQWGPFTYSYTSGGQNADFGGFDPFDVFEEFFGANGFGNQSRSRKGRNLHYEMQVDFVDSLKGVEKEINVESGKVKIRIPIGATDGMQLKFTQKGMVGAQGTAPGDLYITLRVQTPAEFQKYGDTLGVSAEISFIQAVLGDEIEVPIIDANAPKGVGKAKLKIPAGTQPGTQFRLRGKGMPDSRGNAGDVIVQVFISIPKKISKKQKELLEEFKKA